MELILYICAKSSLVYLKLNSKSLFTGPDIRKQISDTQFDVAMNDPEWNIWISFKVNSKFICNEDTNYKKLSESLRNSVTTGISRFTF